MASASSPTWVTNFTDKRPIIGEKNDVPYTTWSKVVREKAAEDPERPQYYLTDDTFYTAGQFYQLSVSVAKSLISLGVNPLDGVNILGSNSVEWFAADVGATLAAVVPSGIYTSNLPAVVSYIINHSKCRVMFVDSEEALDKVLSVSDKTPSMTKIVIWGEFDAAKYTQNADLIITWSDFLKLGSAVPDKDVDDRIELPSPETVCKLIYTSGTTGPPKAVMISHDNFVFVTKIIGRVVEATPEDRIVSYLPCSHIAANSVDIGGVLANGIKCYMAPADALRGSLVNTLKKVRPTIFLSVPRVYEKIQEKLLAIGATAGPVKKAISTWAKGVGTQAAAARDAGEEMMPWGYRLANMIVFSNVRKALGLDECRLFVNTSAPMQAATDAYFKSLNFRILDLYGMSEATGPITINLPEYRAGTSGTAIPGVELKLHNKDEHGEGELCYRGRNVFLGYLNDDEESANCIDDEGYVHSGDLAKIDRDGFVTITGRAKELLVTAGGENVAPVLVESSIISAMPAISRAFAVGDMKKFVSALVVPYMEEDGTLIGPAAAVNPAVKTVVEAKQDAIWQKYLEEGIAKANKQAISSAARVKKFTMLTEDFSVDGGELTPTMKVKRKVVVRNHTDIIDKMY